MKLNQHTGAATGTNTVDASALSPVVRAPLKFRVKTEEKPAVHTSTPTIAAAGAFECHGDRVESLPDGFKVIASTDNAPIAGIADESRKFYGLQFHPEVTHTTQGQAIIQRFLHEVSECHSLWTTENIVEDGIARVKKQVGNDKVLLALSGGVDSSVVRHGDLHLRVYRRVSCLLSRQRPLLVLLRRPQPGPRPRRRRRAKRPPAHSRRLKPGGFWSSKARASPAGCDPFSRPPPSPTPTAR